MCFSGSYVGSRFAIALVLCLLLAGCGSGSKSSSGGAPATGGGGGGGGTGGGGGGGGQGLSRPVVYISDTSQSFGTGNAGGTFSGLIEAFSLNATSGALTRVSGSPFSTNYSTGGDMALAPHSTFAYVLAQQYPAGTCCVGPTSLLVFALDPTAGAPKLKRALATSGASEVSKIAVHPSGHFLYLTPYSDNSGNTGIGVFSVQSDGTVVFAGFTRVQSDGRATMDPNGAFLYTHSDGAVVGNNACGVVNSNLWGFSIDSTTGALTAAAGNPFVFQRQVCTVGHAPQYVTEQIDPSGQRLFVIDSGNATVTVFAIDATSGALTLVPGSSKDSSLSGFYSSAIDPLGSFLYVGSTIDRFTGFSFTANTTSGILPLLPGMPVQAAPVPATNEGSTTMAIDSSGSFLFSNENEFTSAFSCCGADTLVEFQINPNTGALKQVTSTAITLAGSATTIVAAAPQ
jgi:6-phosphogluconolactonase (cycloisomerase 2 family)